MGLFPSLLEITRGKEEEAARLLGPTGIFVGFVFLSTVCRGEDMNKRTSKDLLFSRLGSTSCIYTAQPERRRGCR